MTVLTSFRSFSYSALPAFSRPHIARRHFQSRKTIVIHILLHDQAYIAQRHSCSTKQHSRHTEHFSSRRGPPSAARHLEPCACGLPSPEPRLRQGHFTYTRPFTKSAGPRHHSCLTLPRLDLSLPSLAIESRSLPRRFSRTFPNLARIPQTPRRRPRKRHRLPDLSEIMPCGLGGSKTVQRKLVLL